jgi:cellulose synthase (UDP-forming)
MVKFVNHFKIFQNLVSFVALGLADLVAITFLKFYYFLADLMDRFIAHYHLFEFVALDNGYLPKSPTNNEKYMYIERKPRLLLWFSVISFSTLTFSMFKFLVKNRSMEPLLIMLGLTTIYFLISFIVNIFTKDFDLQAHKELIKKWQPKVYPTIDIFLPICGESINVIKNTWKGVDALKKNYKGRITVYCLDDGDSNEVKQLAKTYNFKYVVRPNRGEFKKAGNLRHGYNISKSRFIVIFDADFRPRKDFLKELLPYMYANKKVGIVQSPQYFDVSDAQGWLERGAGAVQELFYRFSQVSRQSHDASICVGSNAIYRRLALRDTGGTALIEHSEDVHTGFNLRMHGWTIQYIPAILAKGLCPPTMDAFFRQQYRWCMGSLSLLTSKKFWSTKLSIRTRMSYFSGFLYYIHTALMSFFTPIIPLALLIAFPREVALHNYIFILPAFILTQYIYPRWHKATYGIEAWSTRSVYGWAHVFAVYDKLMGSNMHWQPTGSKIKQDVRYLKFRLLQFVFNFMPAVIWVDLATYRLIASHSINFLPLIITGLYYLAIVGKVTFYLDRPIAPASLKSSVYSMVTNEDKLSRVKV